MDVFFDSYCHLIYIDGTQFSINNTQNVNIWVIKWEKYIEATGKLLRENYVLGKKLEFLDVPHFSDWNKRSEILSYLYKNSRPLTYGSREAVNQSVRSIEKLYTRYRNNPEISMPNETVYYILFDEFIGKLEYFKDTESKSTPYSHRLVISTICDRGVKKLNGNHIIGVIHTHPPEVKEWDGTERINKIIYERQTDFDEAQENRIHIPMYSIGVAEIDYYSPNGKAKSKNGLCSNDAFKSGQFNLLKHAFIEYANSFL